MDRGYRMIQARDRVWWNNSFLALRKPLNEQDP